MAELIRKMRVQISDVAFYEVKIWKVPKSDFFVEGLKYSMVIIENENRVLGYDNERGKSHHKHVGGKEFFYDYKGIELLLGEFEKDIEKFRKVKK